MMIGYADDSPMLHGIELSGPLSQPPSIRAEDRKRGSSKRVAPDCVAKHEHLIQSGPLGKCDNPLCTTCPAYLDPNFHKEEKRSVGSVAVPGFLRKLWLVLREIWYHLSRGVINPHTKFVQRWNKFFVLSCLTSVFLDPLFFFLLAVKQYQKCIYIDQKASTVLLILRSITDTIYLMHILLQFRLAYVAPSVHKIERPERRFLSGREVSFATRDLVDNPRKIAWKYLTGWFLLDLLSTLPLPQIMIKLVVPRYMGAAGANYFKNVLRVTMLLQCVPRIIRVLPFLSGYTSIGFIFETAWANFVINILLYLLSGHVVGSCWYLFGLQRVNQCLHNACRNATSSRCIGDFLDCGNGTLQERLIGNAVRSLWVNNENATQCFDSPSRVFTYGIYQPAVLVTTHNNSFTRYIFSLVWGFQQISTLAGNQIPSLFIWEVVFVMTVIGLGLLLLTLLIGNMQSFLQSLGRRSLEMQLKRYEVEKWMTRRHLPPKLRRRVRQFERFHWAATTGVGEEELLEDLPEDLHRDIRRLLFTDLVQKVPLLRAMGEHSLDQIFQRLRQKLYIDGCEVARRGVHVHQMLIIVRGTLQSKNEDDSYAMLRGGDICGEELLTMSLFNSRFSKQIRAISTRTVVCQGNVEAFSIGRQALEEVSRDFKLLQDPQVQRAIRCESHFLRSWGAGKIQTLWRYRKKMRANKRWPSAIYKKE
ncbi:probable cyclic nucleotide-gated ion channel 20, chloroplastic isoform X1 [Selaginella moellendorffii]|uniref:probable cyclic nucleotide-gated ion channel 20, chloroplastic isoform X1 n=1 Tax=Selaginella moellendorffii TaxID=88036 RepID=UPI000D1CA53F|nr:probable cyclic nucleotide-gated ion channel 20, chloroplastic isoform X1 [Selaginella moellendorffii]|eukprot:XP_024524890.1 probable cyclic nucleotide-gated ion channel 20, chloroplastic isoform X1 [Selaginella moellendorffii]